MLSECEKNHFGSLCKVIPFNEEVAVVTHREHEISNIRFDTYPSALLILPAGGESLFRPRHFKCAFGRSDPES